MPSLSVVIPTRNSSQTLPLVLSVLARESEEGMEVIVVDRGSTDDTRKLIEELPGVRLVSFPEASGVSAQRNRGARESGGELILFLDSDALLPEGFFPRMREFFSTESVVAVGSNFYHLPADVSWVARAWNGHLRGYSREGSCEWLPTIALAVRREAFLRVGGFREDLVSCEDVSLGYDLSRQGTLLSSLGLSCVHLREPQTIQEFYRTEVWRGRGSMRTALRNLHRRAELVSLGLVGANLLALLLLLSSSARAGGVCLLFGIPLCMSARSVFRRGEYPDLLPLSVLYFVYNMARLRALFPGRSEK